MKGHYIATLVDLLAERGILREAFLRECDLREEELTAATLIDPERAYRVAQLAVQYTGDTSIGLVAGQRLNINTHGPLGYAAMASEDLAHALQLLVRYYKVQAPRAQFALHPGAASSTGEPVWHLRCESSFEMANASWLTTDFLVTSVFTSTKFLLSGRIQGLEVCFRFAPPPHAEQYAEVFKVPIHFNQAFNGLIVPQAMAHMRLLSADPVAASIFEKRCETLRKDVENHLLSERIRELQMRRAGQFLSQTEIAQQLHLSVSTLHRKLGEEGSSYKQLLADIKRELAEQHILEGLLTVDEIAHLLGFSDASNFRRAFVTWTGKTPSDFRRQS